MKRPILIIISVITIFILLGTAVTTYLERANS